MTEYFAFYGTLMRCLENSARRRAPVELDGLTAYERPCLLAGTLRDHGAYPGFFPHPPDERDVAATPCRTGGLVKGELHRILRPEAFAVLDAYERYDPSDETGSLYVRRRLMLAEPQVEAWVYVSRLSVRDPLVPGSDWAAFVASRQSSSNKSL